MTRASVIIPSWNTRELTLRCLASLEESIGDFAAEIIVVDNGSSDQSAQAIEARHPEIHVIRVDRNLGFAKAVNIGIASAKSPYFVLLNSDTTVVTGAVQHLVEYLDEHAAVGAVGGQRTDALGMLAPGGHRFPCIWHDIAVLPGARDLFLALHRRYFARNEHEVGWVPGTFVAVRRELVDDVGPLPEEFFVYGEDIEWFWRARRAGWVIVYLPGLGVVHEDGASAEQLFGDDTPLRVLDGLHAFAVSHRNPVAWRIGWSVRTASLLGRATWRALRPASTVDDVRILVRHAWHVARQTASGQARDAASSGGPSADNAHEAQRK